MKKIFKKIFSIALGLAITATSAMSISVSAIDLNVDSSDYTIVDDKGMMNKGNRKILYNNRNFYAAKPQYNILKFILREDVDYEEANERVIEIFKEFCSENNIELESYINADKSEGYTYNNRLGLSHSTIDGVTTYTFFASENCAHGLIDEKIAAVKKRSMDFMEKLNEEKLISEFYDFGEVYYLSLFSGGIFYPPDVDIDLINNYIVEHDIDCTVKKIELDTDTNYLYTLEFNDDKDELEQFLIAADIYEATSINICVWIVYDIYLDNDQWYDKNALDELSAKEPLIGDVNSDNKVNVFDLVAFKRYLIDMLNEPMPLLADESASAFDPKDTNGDGLVNITDLVLLNKFLIGQNVTFAKYTG